MTMIRGIGIDSIEIARFKTWHTYTSKKLTRIFSPDEITYCLNNTYKSAERFAVRFAAKEAFFKAFCSMLQHAIPFLTVCKNIHIERKTNGLCSLCISWEKILEKQTIIPPSVHLSLTHTQKIATASVILEDKQ